MSAASKKPVEVGPGHRHRDGDARVFDLGVERLGEREDERLRRGIDGEVGDGLEGGCRGYVEHAARAALDHRREEQPRERDEVRHVERHHRLVDPGIVVHERAELPESGVVHEHVDLVAGGGDFVVERLRGAGRAEVVDEDGGLRAAASKLVGEGVQPVFGAGGEEDVGAVAGELPREGFADAARGAGDEDGAAVVRGHYQMGREKGSPRLGEGGVCYLV